MGTDNLTWNQLFFVYVFTTGC